ncbi:hypothetical protein ACFLYD_06660 [Chloroflexota bacterium]
MTAHLDVAAPTVAQGYELGLIAATVVGDVSLMGSEGSILGVLLGALFMGVLRNELVLVGVSTYGPQAAQGLVIVTAIMLDQLRKRRQ